MKANLCHICKGINLTFVKTDPNYRKVLDHDYITGNCIDAAHNICKKFCSVVYEISLLFHRMRKYDFHLIIHALSRYPNRKRKVIGQTMERYMQIH